MTTLCIVEDDKMTNEAISEYMKSVGYTVLQAYDGVRGLKLVEENSVDLVILDIMLPKLDGFEVLKEIRKISDIPVIMLTALDDEMTQAAGFDSAADDYITKPFSMLLLEKRAAALLRRCQKSRGREQICVGDIIVDFTSYTAQDKSEKIDMTPKEIDLLKLLVTHEGMVLTRTQILDELWGYDYPITERIVDTYIKNLRKKLKTDCIVTIKGVGYKYEVAQ